MVLLRCSLLLCGWSRRKALDARLASGDLTEEQKAELMEAHRSAERATMRSLRKRVSPSDFESLAVIGRGAFGEVCSLRFPTARCPGATRTHDGLWLTTVLRPPAASSCARQVRLVRELSTKRIFAMKSMIKEAMIMKNQVEHVHAERDVLATSSNPRVVTLHYSFQVSAFLDPPAHLCATHQSRECRGTAVADLGWRGSRWAWRRTRTTFTLSWTS